jgi:hypothetical protein
MCVEDCKREFGGLRHTTVKTQVAYTECVLGNQISKLLMFDCSFSIYHKAYSANPPVYTYSDLI